MIINTVYISDTTHVSNIPKRLKWEEGEFMVAHNVQSVYARHMKLRYAVEEMGNSREEILYLRPIKVMGCISFERLFRFYTNSPDFNPNKTIKVILKKK